MDFKNITTGIKSTLAAIILGGILCYRTMVLHVFEYYIDGFLAISTVYMLLAPDKWINTIEAIIQTLVYDLFNINKKKDKTDESK